MRRVVITGLGIVSCLGNNQEEVHQSLLNSKSGISFAEEYKEHNLKSHVHGKPNIKLSDFKLLSDLYNLIPTHITDGAIKKGVYNPDAEHDACGIGFVANIKNIKTNNIVQDGLSILKNLTHRGAVGADPKAGDGCGILTQIPDKFLRKVAIENNIEFPAEGHYGVGNLFLPKNSTKKDSYLNKIKEIVEDENLTILGLRDIPVKNQGLGLSLIHI